MKATFLEFIKQNPNCSKYEQIAAARTIFDFLSTDENIIKMVDSVENKKSGLAGCVQELEKYVDNLNTKDIDLTDGFTRTAIGRMVKTVLAPFGYLPTVQKDFPKSFQLKYFSSASCYEKTGDANMRIVKHIEEIV